MRVALGYLTAEPTKKQLCPELDSNQHEELTSLGPQPSASANSATRARVRRLDEASPRLGAKRANVKTPSRISAAVPKSCGKEGCRSVFSVAWPADNSPSRPRGKIKMGGSR